MEKLTENKRKITKNFAAFSGESDGVKYSNLLQNWQKPVEIAQKIM